MPDARNNDSEELSAPGKEQPMEPQTTEKSNEALPSYEQEDPVNVAISDEKVHVVQAGETLYGISRQYDVTVDELRNWNDLEKSGTLSIGQTLKVQQVSTASTGDSDPTDAGNTQFVVHRVQSGETLYQIARQYNATIKQLMDLNQKPDFNLSVGEELKIPVQP